MSLGNDNWVERIWYGASPLVWLLLPLSWLFAFAVRVRRYLYARGILRTVVTPLPVVVIGNITVGGTGKTPLVIWLARQLEERGFAPGIVTRGYRGNVGSLPVLVNRDSEPAVVGDEAILLAVSSGCPVVVHPDRVAAVQRLSEEGVDIVIADDGLQHYRLGRDMEILVVDAARRFGNGRLLPAGPLREPESRVGSVEEILVQVEPATTQTFLSRSEDPRPRYFSLHLKMLQRIHGDGVAALADFNGKTVHAVAGIGHPERFFRHLESFGIEVLRHPLPDHATITQQDLDFGDGIDIVMTEKDAVKCRGLATDLCWFAPAEVAIDPADKDGLLRSVLENTSLRVSQ